MLWFKEPFAICTSSTLLTKQRERIKCWYDLCFVFTELNHGVARHVEARVLISGFCRRMKQPRVFLLPTGWGTSTSEGLRPSIKFTSTHIYIPPVWREAFSK